jgi:hypothetical protein
MAIRGFWSAAIHRRFLVCPLALDDVPSVDFATIQSSRLRQKAAMNRRTPKSIGFGLVAVLLLAGCSRGGLTLGLVSGQVAVDGKPVKEGVILFVPERGPGASGPIDDGRYVLTTRTPGDGAVVGRHKVYFEPKPPPGDPNTEVREGPVPPPPLKSDFPPSRYATPETSGLTAEVQSGTNTIDFKLD